MTQKEKSLLLRDLCARIPYDPFIALGESKVPIRLGHIVDLYPQEGSKFLDVRMHNAKPYLRPMSSMTEEECIELGNIKATIENISEVIPNIPYYIEVAYSKQIDWLNAHHFDYRGLIEKGLALEAPEDMYNTSQK